MKELFAPIIRRLTRLEEEVKRPRQGNFSRRGSEVTLSADSFTADHHDHFMLQPESGVSDNLATINGGSDGRRIVLYPKDSGDTIIVLTSGNIAAARTLDAQTDALELVYSATLNKWLEPSAATVGGDVAAHAALHYVSAHPSPPASNPSGVYYSVMDGIVGGAGIDESNNLLAMFNRIGALGGGKLIIRSVNPADPIRLDKLVSVYWSNLDIEFRSPVLLGALGGLRIMGELSTFVRAPATNAGKLVSTAAEGTKELLLDTGTGMQASDYLVGDQIIIRGQNDASGNALEKQVANVVATDTGLNKITLAQELEYDFEPTYPGSEWPPDLTTGTTIYIVHTVGLSVDAARSDMEAVGVTNFANAEVGTLYRLSDGRNENELNASAIRGSLLPYENDANMEFVRIVATDSGTNTVVFDRAISNDYVSTTPYFAALAKVLPVRNTHIRGVVATHLVDQTSKNAHVLSMGFAQDCSIEYCILNGQITPTTGRRGQAVRIADSYNCWGRYLYIYDPGHWESSEGYGGALYKSTGGGFENCQAWGGRHNFLVQAATFFTLRDCQSWDDHISGFDLHGVNERDGIIENCTGTRSNRSNPTDASNGEIFRYGNTSHTVGCHYITTTGCKVFGPVGANFGAFGILPASTNLKFISCTVDGAYYGIKFTRNSAQCQPVQSVTDVVFQDVHLYNIVSRAVYVQTNPTYDGVATIGKLERATFKGVVLHNTLEHFHIDGNAGIVDLTLDGCLIVSPVTSPANDFYGFDISDVDGLVIKNASAHRCSRGISLANCLNAYVVNNLLTATIDAIPFADGGGNTGLLYQDNIPATGGAGAYWSAVTGGIGYSAGNVSIGNIVPQNKLHITGSWPGAYGQLVVEGTAGEWSGLTLYREAALGTQIYHRSDDVSIWQNYNAGSFGAIALNPLGGNVGMGGITAPNNTLEIQGAWPGAYGQLTIRGTAAAWSGLTLYQQTVLGAQIYFRDDDVFILQNYNAGAFGVMSLNPLGGNVLVPGGTMATTAWTITPATTINALLKVKTTSTTDDVRFVKENDWLYTHLDVHSDTAGHYPQMIFRRTGGTEASQGGIPASAILGTIDFLPKHTGALYHQRAQIKALVDAALAASSVPTALVFSTGSTSMIERLRISSVGTITGNDDQDIPANFGRTRIGYSAYSDWAWFSHRDMISGGQEALTQSALGETWLNAATGKSIFFATNASGFASANSGLWSITPPLTVTGLITGNGGLLATVARLGNTAGWGSVLSILDGIGRYKTGAVATVSSGGDTILVDGANDVTTICAGLFLIEHTNEAGQNLFVLSNALAPGESQVLHPVGGGTDVNGHALTFGVDSLGAAYLQKTTGGTYNVTYLLVWM